MEIVNLHSKIPNDQDFIWEISFEVEAIHKFVRLW